MTTGRGVGLFRKTSARREWVGGRLAAPLYITEGEPYRPDIVLWLELPEGASSAPPSCTGGAAGVSAPDFRQRGGATLRDAAQVANRRHWVE